jgi:hypothetical protein
MCSVVNARSWSSGEGPCLVNWTTVRVVNRLAVVCLLSASSGPPMPADVGAAASAREPYLYVANRGVCSITAYRYRASGAVAPVVTIAGDHTGQVDPWGSEVYAPGSEGLSRPARTIIRMAIRDRSPWTGMTTWLRPCWRLPPGTPSRRTRPQRMDQRPPFDGSAATIQNCATGWGSEGAPEPRSCSRIRR